MKVGDLVHAPRYPFWGMGVVIGKSSTEVQVHWFDDSDCNDGWIKKEVLEKL